MTQESQERLTDLHRSLIRALETVPYDTTLLSKSGMTVRQFRSDASGLLSVVRSLQDALMQKPKEPIAPGSKFDRMRRTGKRDNSSGSW